ncbi:ketosteroid isomerase family protein [Mycobacterium sp. URHB0021]|jgi:transport factor 2 (NTF2)-like protein
MTFTGAEMLAIAERSPAVAGARDRNAWVGLFTATGRVEDPVGSQPHQGRAAIGRFFDTFIGPREITYHPEVDIVMGPTVIRDGMLEVKMTSALTMRVPTYIRYDLQDDAGELKSLRSRPFGSCRQWSGSSCEVAFPRCRPVCACPGCC